MKPGKPLEKHSDINTHTPMTGKCGFCGITTIHTLVSGFIYFKDGRFIQEGGICEWQVFGSNAG